MSKQESTGDTGLGLSQFVTGHVQEEASPAPVTSDKSTDKPEGSVTEASPSKEEKPIVEPVKEKPVVEKKDKAEPEKKEPKRDASGKFEKQDKQEKKDAAKEQPVVSPVTDWESDANPHKKAASTLEKRFKDTEKWAQQEHQARLKLERQLEIINKKLDGQWTDEDEAKEKQSSQPSPEVIQFHAEVKGRARASKLAAVQQHGPEKVEAWLAKFQEVFGEDRLVNERVMGSEMPVFEAINAVRGYEFFEKYGSDPEKIIEKLTTELKEKLSSEIRDEETNRIMENMKRKDESPTGLGKARQSTIPADKAEKEDSNKPKPLGNLFNQF